MNGSVVLDLDNTIADFDLAFCRKFGWNNRHKWCLEERYPEHYDEIQDFVNNPFTYQRLDLVYLGYRIAKFCHNERIKIHVVSSRPYESISITKEWLERNEVPYDTLSVNHEWKSPKFERIKNILDARFVVDDSLSLARDLSYVDIPTFLINQPWNQEKRSSSGIIHRVKTFDDFLSKFTDFFDDF